MLQLFLNWIILHSNLVYYYILTKYKIQIYIIEIISKFYI